MACVLQLTQHQQEIDRQVVLEEEIKERTLQPKLS